MATKLIKSKMRKLKWSDAPWVKEIYKECKKELGSFNLYQCWDNYVAGESNEVFLGVPNVAFIRWKPSKKYASNMVMDIGVLKEFRRCEFGLQLIYAVPLPITLKCNEDNEAGNKFYKSIGFTKAGVTHTRKGVKQNIWVCAEW